MKIVILDSYTANPGDLDWSPFEKLGDLKLYARSGSEKVLERSKNADILLTNKAQVPGDIIKKCTHLKYIGELATGYDNIAIDTAAQQNIPVCNVPGYSTPSVVQLTWAFILNYYNNVSAKSNEVHEGAWVNSKDFSFGGETLRELQGKTLGLIGLGDIGSKVAKVGLAFGMNITAVVRHPEKYAMEGVKITRDYDQVFEHADILSLHCPLTDENKGLINAKSLEKMKPSAILINTARGGLIDENDLAHALNNNVISGASADVLSSEPPKADNPLLKAKNCVITPHIGWATKESRKRLLKIALTNIEGFLNGSLKNVVNNVKK